MIITKDLVRIYPNMNQKYILVRAIRAGTESVLLWGNPNVQWHKDILDEMKDAGLEVTETLGGGWLFIDQEKGVKYVWGTSDRLGPAPIEIVRELLGGEIFEEEPQ